MNQVHLHRNGTGDVQNINQLGDHVTHLYFFLEDGSLLVDSLAMCPNLEFLHIMFDVRIPDDISHPTHLHSVVISVANETTLGFLKSLPSLNRLFIGLSSPVDLDLCSSLKYLDILVRNTDEFVLPSVGSLNELLISVFDTELFIDIQALTHMTNLEKLELKNCMVKGNTPDLSHLPSLVLFSDDLSAFDGVARARRTWRLPKTIETMILHSTDQYHDLGVASKHPRLETLYLTNRYKSMYQPAGYVLPPSVKTLALSEYMFHYNGNIEPSRHVQTLILPYNEREGYGCRNHSMDLSAWSGLETIRLPVNDNHSPNMMFNGIKIPDSLCTIEIIMTSTKYSGLWVWYLKGIRPTLNVVISQREKGTLIPRVGANFDYSKAYAGM
jgi:hypothetical protein